MYQLIHFPSDALPDIRALIQLNSDQLKILSDLLNTKEAAPPIDQDFEDLIAEKLAVGPELAESVVRISLILQGRNLENEDALKVVEDFEQLIRKQKPNDHDELLRLLHKNRDGIINVIQRKPEITRELQRRNIASGTQPAIESIRTLVHLRPLFIRNDIGKPVDIECLIPAMTLELKYERDSREHSATFGLTQEKLDELIGSLEDARAKWSLLNQKYSREICD